MIFVGASPSTRRELAPAKGWLALTLHSCLVQPGCCNRTRKEFGAVQRAEVNSFRGNAFREVKNLQNSGLRLLTIEAI
jgi:hypothetical protein